MKKIALLITLSFILQTTKGQEIIKKSHLGRNIESYYGSTLKINNKQDFYSGFYTDYRFAFQPTRGKYVYLPKTKIDYILSSNELFGVSFYCIDILKLEYGWHFLKLINEKNNDTLYYYYYLNEFAYNENNPFPFEITKLGKELPKDFYCKDLVIENDKSKISSPPNMINFDVYRDNNNSKENIYLKIKVNNADIDFKNKELTVIIDDNTKFIWHDINIETKKTNNGLEFSSSVLLDSNQIIKLSKNVISGFKIANNISDSDEIEARFLKGYIGCLMDLK